MQRLLLLLLCLPLFSAAQTKTIPGYTGYAVPAEQYEDRMFTKEKGAVWTDAKQELQYFFHTAKAGSLQLALRLTNVKAGTIVQVQLAGKTQKMVLTSTKAEKTFSAGNFAIPDSGFYMIRITALKKSGASIAEIRSIDISGTATEGIHFNEKPRRNAASVHLRYPIPDTMKAVAFYNEITVPAGADPVHTYYMACGFARGYFGMQVNSATERRIIFSVWDAGNEAVDRNRVADSNKVQLIAKGENVIAEGFGNEGTGGHSHWVYPWKTGTTYAFMVTALPDSAGQTTIYAGYFKSPEAKGWKLVAAFRAPKDGKYLRSLYSFSENFVGLNGQLERKAYYGNSWVQRENGSWKELLSATFSYDATGKARDRIDYGAGLQDTCFYLAHGGYKISGVKWARYGDTLDRQPSMQRPLIDWTKNADSLAQLEKDRQLIFASVAEKKIDTSGNVQGVYYQILTAGSGDPVRVEDTVTVYYKGSLLSDGSIFDQTRDNKAATFPLKRLIRGWQIGLPMCRAGGKIRLIIPSALAYSIRTRSKAIPPNSVLVFDIEVLSVKHS
jgi:FKBP-type peptidyl-prolyl cis-trans isomerase